MKFENRGKWLQEAEDKLAAYDTQEHPDYLDGDSKVCTFEDEDLDAIEDTELDMVDEDEDFEEDELDIVEEEDTLDSPEEEEDMLAMESSQKNEVWTDIYGILGNIGEKRYFNKQKELSRADMEKAFRKALKIKGLKPTEHDIEVALNKYYEESSQKNEADLSAYKQILNGAKLILQQKGFKEDKSLTGKDGIFFIKGDKAVTIDYFDANDDVQVMGYNIKEQEDTYIKDFKLNKISKLNIEDSVKSAIKSLNESSQKNEMNYKTASEYTRAARQAIDIINKFIEDEKESAKSQGYGNAEMRQMNTKISKLKEAIKELEFYKLESSQKNEGPDEFKDNKYERDFFEYKNGGHGDFMEYLAKACMQADKKNLAKIQKEFPELTKAFCLWKSSGKTDKAEKL